MSDGKRAGLPSGWVAAPLAEIARINPPLDRSIVSDEVLVTFVPMRAVGPEGAGLLQPEVRRYGEVRKGYTSFLSGDVIMAKITPCMENGKTAVVPETPGNVCFGSTEFHSVRPEEGVQPKWIAQFLLQHEVRRIAQRQMTGGVGQMRVPASFLQEIEIPVAPSSEQSRINDTLDELLSDLDAGVAALERVRAKLKLYRASVLKAAVEGALTTEWRVHHPHTEHASEMLRRILAERRSLWEEDQLAKFRATGRKLPPTNWKAKYQELENRAASNFPIVPDGWCMANLGELAWQTGYGTSEKCRETNTGIAVLRIPNIIAGRLDLDALKFAPAEYEERQQDLVNRGDLLIVRTNGSRNLIGRGAVVHDEQLQALSFASYLIRFRLVPSLVLLRWISLLWDSLHVRGWIEERAATSAGQYNIGLGVLERLNIPIPPTNEQEAIVEAAEGQLSVIDHLDADLDDKLRAAQSLRQSILRQAFIGQLVPQDPNDEPAAELLKRIASERAAGTQPPTRAKRGVKSTVSQGAAKRGRPRKILEPT